VSNRAETLKAFLVENLPGANGFIAKAQIKPE